MRGSRPPPPRTWVRVVPLRPDSDARLEEARAPPRTVREGEDHIPGHQVPERQPAGSGQASFLRSLSVLRADPTARRGNSRFPIRRWVGTRIGVELFPTPRG